LNSMTDCNTHPLLFLLTWNTVPQECNPAFQILLHPPHSILPVLSLHHQTLKELIWIFGIRNQDSQRLALHTPTDLSGKFCPVGPESHPPLIPSCLLLSANSWNSRDVGIGVYGVLCKKLCMFVTSTWSFWSYRCPGMLKLVYVRFFAK
jgi:hypothetical protein